LYSKITLELHVPRSHFVSVFFLLSCILFGCARIQQLGGQAAAPLIEDDATDHSKSTAAENGAGVLEDTGLKRRIAYDANIRLETESFATVSREIRGLTGRFHGFVAKSQTSGRSGARRWGTWTLRIPEAEYRGFVDAIGELGEVIEFRESSHEVTAEYYDLEARIQNKQREESRLLELLAKYDSKLDEVLRFEREISRVRGEVEQMQGRLRVLRDITSLATVTLSVTEVVEFEPKFAATFGTRIRRVWTSSSDELLDVVQQIVIFFVGAILWLVVFGIPLATTAYIVLRKIGNPTKAGVA
jgi:hypothetical protein